MYTGVLSHASSLRKLAFIMSGAVRSGGAMRRHFRHLYNEALLQKGTVPAVSLDDVIAGSHDVLLSSFVPRIGEISHQELIALVLLAKASQPHVLLEVGAADGNTMRQLASNLPNECRLVSIDPSGPVSNTGAATGHGAQTVAGRVDRVQRVVGDTRDLDFLQACDGQRADFVFVNAEHSYECVRNDSEKAFACLAPNGMVVWHDYSHQWPGVYQYLNELARDVRLLRIRDTSLVIYQGAAQ